jgi:hypothetical protein
MFLLGWLHLRRNDRPCSQLHSLFRAIFEAIALSPLLSPRCRMQRLYLCRGLTGKYVKRMINKIIHVMPKSMAMTSSGRVLLSDIIENAGTRKTEGAGEWTRS